MKCRVTPVQYPTRWNEILMCGSNAMAQALHKAPPAPAPNSSMPSDGKTLAEGLQDLQDPNPERFNPRSPLFPTPPGKSDGETEADRKRRQDGDPTPYLGS